MTIQCVALDPDAGVALRISAFLDCQSRALGENGFQALVGGPLMTALLSGALTIYVALIGYRFVLGAQPAIRDAVGWVMKLGIVLALVTSWPAFSTLVYDVVADGPQELADIILPASGSPATEIDVRAQAIYDDVRLLPTESPPGSPAAPTAQPTANGEVASANAAQATTSEQATRSATGGVATLFAASTVGLIGTLHLVIGFLIAFAPIPVLCLLFRGTTGFFDGWVRAIAGAAIASLAATIVASLEISSVASEIAHIRAVREGSAAISTLDPQALETLVIVFAVAAFCCAAAAGRVASAFRLPIAHMFDGSWQPAAANIGNSFRWRGKGDRSTVDRERPAQLERPRSAAIAEALSKTARREELAQAGSSPAQPSRASMLQGEGRLGGLAQVPQPSGVAARRTTGRRTQSAMRRDRGQ